MRPLGIGGKTGGGQEEGLGKHLLGQPVPCWSTSNKIDMTRDMDESAVLKLSQLETLGLTRLEICHDRRDRQSCKIFVSCVNFPGNNAVSYIFCNFTHT